jgi:general secretion pathway protein C
MINFETESRRHWVTALLLMTALLCAAYWIRAGLSDEETRPFAAAPAPNPVVAGTAAELARVLGAPRPTLAGAALGPTERFNAIGVMASASGQGVALVSVDKQPARPFGVGASIAPGFVLKSVSQREIKLADSVQGEVTLPLPDPAKVKSDALGNNPPALLPSVLETEAGPPSLPSIRGAPRTP